MKTYHVYKIKEDKINFLKRQDGKITKPEIVKIGLVDYVFNENTGEFIPFEEYCKLERRPK